MKIVIVVETYRHWLFFMRFESAFEELKIDVLVFTPMVSVWLEARKRYSAFFCTNVKAEKNYFSEHDVRSGKLDRVQSRQLYNNIYSKLEKVCVHHVINYVWLWNGVSSASLAGSDFAKENKISRRFFEIANMPGKIFVDDLGVNLKSSLYRWPEQLDYPSDLEKYRSWREKYLSEKLLHSGVPQAFSNKKVYWNQWVDLVLQILGLSQLSARVRLLETFAVKKKFDGIEFDCVPENGSFIFFPIQVSTDTQLTINSDVDNFGAIKFLSRYAKEKGVKLCVKPHPAERDFNFNAKVLEFAKREGALISNANTFSLIKGACEVVVINSTVGLESLIFGKPTKFLGNSFFSFFGNEDFIANYINDFLINEDFFDENPVPASVLMLILGVESGFSCS